MTRTGPWYKTAKRDKGDTELRRLGLSLAIMAVLPWVRASAETKQIFTIPPIQWDAAMARDKPALAFGPSDLAALTGGIVFGLPPARVSAMMPNPAAGMDWASLPFANEYPNDVRYFWARLEDVRALREGIKGCVGANSYVVFLFSNRGLFRISWRLPPDASCPSPSGAALDLYARYLSLDGAAAVATHYRANKTEAVEITDPGAGYLMPFRWENRQRR